MSLELTLATGADPNILSLDSSLVDVARNGDIKAIKMLLESGADPNVVDSYGLTPLEAAARSGYSEAFKMLFPLTSKIPGYPDWSEVGVLLHLFTDDGQIKKEQIRRRMEMAKRLESTRESNLVKDTVSRGPVKRERKGKLQIVAIENQKKRLEFFKRGWKWLVDNLRLYSSETGYRYALVAASPLDDGSFLRDGDQGVLDSYRRAIKKRETKRVADGNTDKEKMMRWLGSIDLNKCHDLEKLSYIQKKLAEIKKKVVEKLEEDAVGAPHTVAPLELEDADGAPHTVAPLEFQIYEEADEMDLDPNT